MLERATFVVTGMRSSLPKMASRCSMSTLATRTWLFSTSLHGEASLLGEIIEEKPPRKNPRDQTNNPKPTQGWLLQMPVLIPDRSEDLRQIYWKVGIRHEVYDWLLAMAGPTGTYVQWAECDPTVGWIYTGANQLAFDKNRPGRWSAVQLRFRDKGVAALFKLTWWDKL